MPSDSPITLAAHSSHGLISREFLAQAAPIIGTYGDLPASYFTELRLGPDPQTDLLFAIPRSQSPLISEMFPTTGSPHSRLAALARTWQDPASLMHTRTPFIWLEVDDVLGQPSDASFAVCLIPSYRRDLHKVPAPDREKELAQAREAFTQFIDPIPASLDAETKTCFRALPRGGIFIHASAMTGRSPATLKLYGSIPNAACIEYLSKIGWQQHADELTTFLQHHFRDGEDIFIDLTLGQLGGRLAFASPQQHAFRETQNRADRIERYLAANLCTSDQAEKLRAWAGCDNGLYRWLDFKLVWVPGQAVQLKAYLGFCRSGSALAS